MTKITITVEAVDDDYAGMLASNAVCDYYHDKNSESPKTELSETGKYGSYTVTVEKKGGIE